ncbi:MAG: 3-phosphoshikimate 1-carboxyvinyltransferase [Bryobacteraceae bacterium]|nr:MAG: 3-phosphoshikimate 1-carboxyvinyltransferase [Bryobacteraceae bacterium]
MVEVIHPARRLHGSLTLPGDKSISHRYAMLASVAGGLSTIRNYSSGADCHSTLRCIRSLGIEVEVQGSEVRIRGRGLHGYQAPAGDLDAGNSGSTIRMLSGLLAGQPFESRLVGDESLSRRPMQRIMEPLRRMGASVEAREGKYPPLVIRGGELQPIDYESPVASAQVKSCVLLAGLMADGATSVREPARTRDHTEVALREFGAEVESGSGWARVRGPARLEPRELVVPGDLSSAAFFLAAAAMLEGSDLILENIGLNPTRAALIDFLAAAGARIQVLDIGMRHGEPVGVLRVRGSKLAGGVIEKGLSAALIDEIPVLAVLGAVSEEGLTVRDAAELRVKETDRIETVAENLRRLGVKVETAPDGLRVEGRQRFRAGTVDSFGDHRIAMAFAVAGLSADGPVTIEGAEAASVSFPEFWSKLREAAGQGAP